MSRITMTLVALLSLLLENSPAVAHPGHSHRPAVKKADDATTTGNERTRPVFRPLIQNADDEVQLGLELLAANELPLLLAQRDQTQTRTGPGDAPGMAKAFEAFVKLNAIKTRWDDRFFYVESKGIPDHRMMVGITAWQQQVPLPQSYTGNNAWRIPLHPVEAKNPLSAKSHFFRGAIAMAVNGVPIFNPIKNDGKTDTLLA